MLVMTFVGINALLGQLGSFRDVAHALGDARWGWVLLALAISVLVYPVAASATMASVRVPLRFGSVVVLQLAGKFANLVTPAGLGSTAVNMRFLNRHGVGNASALTADAATGLVGTVAEWLLVGLCVAASRRRFSFGGLPPGTGRVVLIVVVVIGVVVAVLSRIPEVRRAVLPHLRAAWGTITDLVRSPARTLVMAGAALCTSLLFALCLGASLAAYGGELSLAALVVVNWSATTVGSVSTVPGGLGVTEASLVAGLTAAGVPPTVAVAGALTHRLLTFWLPPFAGWLALRRLSNRQLI